MFTLRSIMNSSWSLSITSLIKKHTQKLRWSTLLYQTQLMSVEFKHCACSQNLYFNISHCSKPVHWVCHKVTQSEEEAFKKCCSKSSDTEEKFCSRRLMNWASCVMQMYMFLYIIALNTTHTSLQSTQSGHH